MKRVYEKEADGFKGLQFFEEKNVKIKATINPPPPPQTPVPRPLCSPYLTINLV